jgi:hypothetical protein
VGRHDRKHSDVSKAAVVAAVLDQGLTAAQVVTLAAAGELKAPGRRDRCKPFEIAESTVRYYVACARRRLRRNGHRNDESNVALAVRDAAGAAPNDAPLSRAASSHAPDGDLEASPLLQLLLEREHDFEEACAAGERCQCLDPQPAPWHSDRELAQCLECRLPTPNG